MPKKKTHDIEGTEICLSDIYEVGPVKAGEKKKCCSLQILVRSPAGEYVIYRNWGGDERHLTESSACAELEDLRLNIIIAMNA